MRRLIYIPTFLVLVLGACTGILDLNEVVLEDVRQARIMAERTDDTLASKCWVYLEKVAEANAPVAGVPRGNVVGALSAYQKVRNVRRAVTKVRNSDQLKMECGPMLIDSVQAVRRAGLRALLPF